MVGRAKIGGALISFESGHYLKDVFNSIYQLPQKKLIISKFSKIEVHRIKFEFKNKLKLLIELTLEDDIKELLILRNEFLLKLLKFEVNNNNFNNNINLNLIQYIKLVDRRISIKSSDDNKEIV